MGEQLDLLGIRATPHRASGAVAKVERSESTCLVALVCGSTTHMHHFFNHKDRRQALMAICLLAGCIDCNKTAAWLNRVREV